MVWTKKSSLNAVRFEGEVMKKYIISSLSPLAFLFLPVLVGKGERKKNPQTFVMCVCERERERGSKISRN
jgi:hypothetical protein